MANLTKLALAGIAQEASDAYLGDGQPLDQKIAALAQERDLEPDEVRRVAELANQATYADLWKRASGPRTIEFDRADAERILEDINLSAAPQAKIARFHKAARLGRPTGQTAGLTALAKQAAEASVRETGTMQHRLEHLHAIAKIGSDRIREGIAAKEAEKRAAEISAAEWCRDELLDAAQVTGGIGSRRGNEALCKQASLIVHAVAARRPELVKTAARLAAIAGRSLDGHLVLDVAALEKQAAPIEGHRISGFLATEDVPVSVVNGDHKLFMDLEIVQRLEKDLAALRYNLVKADDTSHFVACRIRESSGLPAGGRG